jgi:Domain of unknown function (DUF4386)
MTRTTNARLAGFTFLFYIAAGLTMMAAHNARLSSVLTIFTSLSALVLGVTLYALTRGVDADLALLALTCRVLEAVAGDDRGSAIFFAVGSTIFSVLLLRGRLIPAWIAWLGVTASALLVVILPLQRAGFFAGATSFTSAMTWMVWMPALVFEVTLAFWLMIKGVRAPAGAIDARVIA